jgi:hypothetical protein
LLEATLCTLGTNVPSTKTERTSPRQKKGTDLTAEHAEFKTTKAQNKDIFLLVLVFLAQPADY